jgi:hypothetical protein
MLNADRAPYFENCPRCGDGGLQQFSTHSYCVSCNYSDVYYQAYNLPIPQWAFDALKTAGKKSKKPSLALIPPKNMNPDMEHQNPASSYDNTENEAS